MNGLLDFLLLLLSVEEWRKKHEIATVRISQLDSSHSSFASELQRLSKERDELQVWKHTVSMLARACTMHRTCALPT